VLKLQVFLSLNIIIRSAIFDDDKDLKHNSLIEGLERTADAQILVFAKNLRDLKIFRAEADYEIINKAINKAHAKNGIEQAEELMIDYNSIGQQKFIRKLKDYYRKTSA